MAAGIRLLLRRTPNQRTAAEMKSVAQLARVRLRAFVHGAVKLYGEEFCVHNVHSLIHLSDDYERCIELRVLINIVGNYL